MIGPVHVLYTVCLYHKLLSCTVHCSLCVTVSASADRLVFRIQYTCTLLRVSMQGQRLASLNRFKSGHVRILVATDVASR